MSAYFAENAPLVFKYRGHADGMLVDVVRAIQHKVGDDVTFEIFPLARAHALAMHQPNLIVLGAKSISREQYVRYIGAVTTAHVSIYTLRNRVNELRKRGTDLHTVRCAARHGSVIIDIARQNGYRVSEEPIGLDSALGMLIARRFDIWAEADELIPYTLQKAGLHSDAIVAVQEVSAVDINIGFTRGTNQQVIIAWENALLELKRDGTLQAIQERWIPSRLFRR